MKKYICILLFILMILLSSINGISQQDGIIKIVGKVTSNGEGIKEVQIKVTNKDTNEEWITKTNDNGSYEILVPAKNNDEITVEAKHNSKEIERSIIVKSSIKTYEVNFEFEEPVITKIISKGLGFISGLDLFSIIFFVILFLLFILICASYIHHRKYYYKNRKYNKVK